jgi:Glycosyl transferase family 21
MIFLFIYGFLFFLSSMALLGCIAAAATIGWRYSLAAQDLSQGMPVSSLSMIVPLKGVDDFTAAHLNALVESRMDVPVEFLFALESAHDPAFVVCQQVQEYHGEKDIRLIVSGSAAGRMGKQHNLAVASQHTRYEAIGSMDADVLVEPDTLAVGLCYLALPQTGVAYFLPAYVGPGPTGGLLVALYSNYYYQLYMGALALSRNAPFITGALWFMRKNTLRLIGGLEQFGLTISDDAAIGRAIHKQNLRNVLIPRTVRIPFEQLDLLRGGNHILKWMAMLRAEGLLTFLTILLLWHPILWSFITFLVGLLLFGIHQPVLISGAVLLICALLVRLASAFLLNRRVYALPGLRYLWFLPVYELLAVPILFGKRVFQRTIHWRGRRYRLGRHGMIQEFRGQEGGSS